MKTASKRTLKVVITVSKLFHSTDTLTMVSVIILISAALNVEWEHLNHNAQPRLRSIKHLFLREATWVEVEWDFLNPPAV